MKRKQKKQWSSVMIRTLVLSLILVCGVAMSAFAAKKPGKVKKVKAIAGESMVTVKWKAQSDVSGYKVFKVDSKSGKKTCIKTIPSASRRKAKIRNLTNGKKYTFCVAAYSGKGKNLVLGKYSKTVSAKPRLKTPGEAAPHLLEVKKNSVTFTWTKADNATTYNCKLYDKTSKKTVYISEGKLKKVTKVTIDKLTRGDTYKLTVTAVRTVDGSSVEGPASSVKFTAAKDYISKQLLGQVVEYSNYTSSNTNLVYSKEVAEAYANYGNSGSRFNSNTNYFIWINFYTRRLFAFERKSSSSLWTLVFSTPCIIGRPSAQTPRRSWTIVGRRHPGSGCYYMNYLEMGTYGIHSLILGQSDWSSLKHGYLASAGCIRVMVDYAQWIYNTTPIGTAVLTR